MSEQTPPPSATTATSTPAGDHGITADDAEKGKVLAVISYIIPLVAIIVLIMRDNRFSLYHAKQCLTMIICAFPFFILSVIPLVGCIVGPLTGLAFLTLAIIGIINAVNGRTKPVPVIGKFGEKWFASLTVKTAGAPPA